MLRDFSKAFAFAFLLSELGGALSAYAAAAPKGPGPLVTKTNTTKLLHVANVGGNSVNVTMYCYKGAGGKVTKVGKYKYFLSYSKLLKEVNQKLKVTSNPKTKNTLKKQKSLYQVLKADGAVLCSTAQQPSHSLTRYSGPFGLKQAQRLVEVFALGGRPGLAQHYADIGLDAAIDDLTTLKDDSEVEVFRARLTCGNHPREPQLDTCYEDGDINDFYMDGLVAGLNWRMLYTNNPAFAKLQQFVMDERAPANPRVLDGEAQWMFKDYILALDRFMISGNYKAYVADMVVDPVAHGMWLSGAANHLGVLAVGNEDFARESLELLTTGVRKPDGSPVYNDLDVYENSKAMSGLGVSRAMDAHGHFVKAVGNVPAFHAPGIKRLFAGTPQEMQIDNASDFAREIFIKQRDQVAYELAWRLWRRFINSSGTTSDHLQLAEIIKNNDFQLWPVMKAMMASSAFYAPESYKSILKDPNTYYVTAVRMSGMPIDYWEWVHYTLGDLGMRLGRPPSVFGFNYQNRQLGSDFYQLARYNWMVYHFLYQNMNDLKEDVNWTPYTGLVENMPLTGNPARDFVNEIMKRMNLADSWNEDQKDALEHSINYYLYNCGNQNDPLCFRLHGQPSDQLVRWYRDAPDVGDTESDFYRVRMGYLMAVVSPAFGAM